MCDHLAVPRSIGARRGERLWTAGVFLDEDEHVGVMFVAALAITRDEAAARLSALAGREVARERPTDGFDPSDPYAAILVSDALGREMSAVAADASAVRYAGYSMRLERRFRA